MMKNKIFSILMISTLLVFVVGTVIANAVTFTATMTPSSSTVEESTEFTVTIAVSNLSDVDNGINALSGNLEYDTDVFDEITDTNIEALNKWKCEYDASSGKIELSKSTFVTSTQEVLQITFKTKSGVSGKKGTISYSNITASNSEDDEVTATDISTSITVGSSSSNNTSTNVIAANTAANNTVENNTSNTNVSTYVNTMQNTSTNDDMPDTGVDDTIMLMMFILIFAALGFYIKIEKINKEIK